MISNNLNGNNELLLHLFSNSETLTTGNESLENDYAVGTVEATESTQMLSEIYDQFTGENSQNRRAVLDRILSYENLNVSAALLSDLSSSYVRQADTYTDYEDPIFSYQLAIKNVWEKASTEEQVINREGLQKIVDDPQSTLQEYDTAKGILEDFQEIAQGDDSIDRQEFDEGAKHWESGTALITQLKSLTDVLEFPNIFRALDSAGAPDGGADGIIMRHDLEVVLNNKDKYSSVMIDAASTIYNYFPKIVSDDKGAITYDDLFNFDARLSKESGGGVLKGIGEMMEPPPVWRDGGID
ncbi:MAG: hypothetical protein P8176_06965 [Gammaproteobacteria bacterium]